ncbi:transmembrane protein, putative [Medicago truncatula]|uniref:Transmembrane protein, putative n=1 Tax=Medicago truncatula TaxID=3880 RepID=G7IZC9_MEDTR|nr:transmembrane protein, putative [Medicago truncatula]
MGKTRTFSINSGRNFHYKYQLFSFRISRSELEKFKRKATLELRESFYLPLDFLGYVFIFSNLLLVTMCN